MSHSVHKFHQIRHINIHKLKRGMHYDLQLISKLINMEPIAFHVLQNK